jgi:putative membrane protein
MSGEVMSPQARKIWIRALIGLGVPVLIAAALFLWWPSRLYDWVKAAHVIAIIAWMAGMLYLPRLFVYHCKAEPGSTQSETFKVMERRLLNAIINPAMVLSWAFGLWLMWEGSWYKAGWMLAKLGLVFLLSWVHGMFSAWVRQFAEDRNRRSQIFYRAINEVPTLLMIGIVILVVVKPF